MKTPASLADKRICRYVRVSNDIQEGDRQVFSTDSWAKYNGLFIQKSYEDIEGNNSRDLSAKRVQFQKMMKACEAGDYDAIVVDSLDRFGFKNNKELQHYLYMLDQWGTELWSVSQGCISDDDVATIFNTTAAAITSEKEQHEKAIRNLEGRMNNSRKGNYSGGPPPYGTDVVCYGPDGKEKWRVIWMAKQKRIKKTPDGLEEAYDGKNNFPARDSNDTLRLSPSIKTERLECIRQIFQWYADELISYYQIAVRLNKREVESLFSKSKTWNKGHVQHILHNPVFIGIPTDNKKSQARFCEYKNGKVVKANPDELNRVKQERDRWRPEQPIFDPIVSLDVWAKVQEKLALRAKKKSGPNPHRREEFWLQPFVYCKTCGKKMRSCNVKSGIKGVYAKYYCCSTYSGYGQNNEYGCHCNTAKKEMIEEVVKSYLSEARNKLLFDNKLDNLPYDYQFTSLSKIYQETQIPIRVEDNFKKYIRDQLDGINLKSGLSLAGAYKSADQELEKNEDIIRQIKIKQDEFEKVYQHSKYLTEYAKDRANEEMNTLSKDIRLLRARLAPQDRCLKIEREISTLERSIDSAISAMSMDNGRQKAETVGKVIQKIICRFDNRTKDNEYLMKGNFGAKKRKTVLAEIIIVPVSMELELFKINNNDNMDQLSKKE